MNKKNLTSFFALYVANQNKHFHYNCYNTALYLYNFKKQIEAEEIDGTRDIFFMNCFGDDENHSVNYNERLSSE